MAEASVAAGIVRGMIKVAASRGADPRALLRSAGLEAVDFEDQDKRIPLPQYRALIRSGQRLAEDPALALHYGETVDPTEVSIVGLIGHASQTMAHAFVQLQRYARLMLDLGMGKAQRFELTRRGDDVWLVDNRTNPNAFLELTETAFAQMVTGCRPFGVDPFAKAVRVTHSDPGYRGEYERIIGAPITFGCEENALLLEQRFLNHPIALQPRYVFGILSEYAEALLRQLENSTTTRGRVERHLMAVLHTGTATMDLIAGSMGASSQTLYRALKAEGVTFEEVVRDLRHRLALDYLSGKKVSVNETAYLLGFSDPAAFSRAFKRWTGLSPRAMRGNPRAG